MLIGCGILISDLYPFSFPGIIHCDSHPVAAATLFRHWVKKEGREDLETGRFMYLTAWRNIADTPVRNDHLVLCDERSVVKPDDYMVRDFFFHDEVLYVYV